MLVDRIPGMGNFKISTGNAFYSVLAFYELFLRTVNVFATSIILMCGDGNNVAKEDHNE
jgi:hypothetical protein